MSDVADFSHIPTASKQDKAGIPLPAPMPFGAPVLISDCVSPLAGETLLSLLWKRLDSADVEPD